MGRISEKETKTFCSVDWIFRVGYGLDWVFARPLLEINVLLGQPASVAGETLRYFLIKWISV
jgi:hypothetical protein